MVDERVHPNDISFSTSAIGPLAIQLVPAAAAPPPKPGTYVIHVPKDQIYRVPAPEEAIRFQEYSRRAALRGRRSSRCCYYSLAALAAGLFLLLLLALAATILFLVFRPRIPRYSLGSLSIHRLIFTVPGPISPRLDAAVRVVNPNARIGISSRDGGSVAAYYSGVELCDGVWPAFYQGRRNVTVSTTAMTGSGVRLAAAAERSLVLDQRRGMVPLEIGVRVWVRFKFGAVESWWMTVKVRCDVTVDKLTVDSKIVSQKCRSKLDVF